MPDPVPLVSRPLAEHTVETASSALAACFEGYAVPLRTSAKEFERRFRGEHLDAFASRIYWRGDRPAAVVFVTRRGWTARVGAMGVAVPERRSGVGRRVMEAAVAEARARGDRTLLLEVLERNEPALALYRGLGFRAARRLVGYRRPGTDPAVGASAPEEVDPAEAARVVHAEGEPGLPWMLTPETLAAATAPVRAFRLGGRAWAVVADPDAETLVPLALVVSRAHRRAGWGRRMLDALSAAFPGRPLGIGAVVPEALAPEFFARTGFVRQEPTQLEMVLSL